MTDIDSLICHAADPEKAQRRFDDLDSGKDFHTCLSKLSPAQLQGVLAVLGYSDFMSNYLRRYPGSILHIGNPYTPISRASISADKLRQHKYSELFKLTARDLMDQEAYENILRDTSMLADEIINGSHGLFKEEGSEMSGLCVIGLGKLGARELNYSSDIDLIFVCNDPEINEAEYIEHLIGNIRRFTRLMEEVTGDGFLYRVDLKLRPWGRSGPLVLTLEDTENYYSASTEAWERFIWLRARAITGNKDLGNELLRRLDPFIYRKSLSEFDLRRFLEIKSDMQMHHRKAGNWNVKQGAGGIRDIEFFIQLLQIVNAHDQAELKLTNTLEVLGVLVNKGLIQNGDATQIRDSYLFLRRLENHLQMIDERQTHQLPDDRTRRKLIARSMIHVPESEDALEIFEEQLGLHQTVARSCFERILPGNHLIQ